MTDHAAEQEAVQTRWRNMSSLLWNLEAHLPRLYSMSTPFEELKQSVETASMAVKMGAETDSLYAQYFGSDPNRPSLQAKAQDLHTRFNTAYNTRYAMSQAKSTRAPVVKQEPDDVEEDWSEVDDEEEDSEDQEEEEDESSEDEQ